MRSIWAHLERAGFRGPEYPPLPEPGVTRIAVLGDSVTYGWHVRCESIYPVVLERALNEITPEGERFEVINAATSAYNVSYIEASYRLKVRKYHPSIVLYGFFPNDLDKLHVHQVEGNPPAVVLVRPEYFDAPETAWIPARGRALLERRSYVYNWLSARAWARAVARGEVGRKAGRLEERKTQIEALERLRRKVEKDGAGFAMALIPPAIIRSDDPAFCRSGKLPPEQVPRCEETHLIFALAREAARREGIRLIEVLGAYSTPTFG